MKKVVIIGAGIGGLASAIRFAKKGYQVEVFEASNSIGGKIKEIKTQGFRFDSGPSLFTMPELVNELIHLGGKTPKTYFPYFKLKKNCIYFFEDGTKITGYSNLKKFAMEVFKKTKTPAKYIFKHLKKSKFIYNATKFIFLEQSLHKISTYISFNTLISFLKIPFLNIFKSMNRVNKKTLKNKKIVQLFNRYATYNGSNPYEAPGVLNIIPHLEFNQGVYFPRKGMVSIPKTLYNICKELGVVFHLNSSVDKIKVVNNQIKGVVSLGQFHKVNTIVCNIDVYFVYKNLLPKKFYFKKHLLQERSSSAIIFYWGIRKKFKKLDLHNIFFSKNYQLEFEQIFRKKTIPDDPTIYINITSKYKPDDAPNNCENWFVMINVPPNTGQNWRELVKLAKKNIIKKLNNMLDESIQDLIVFEKTLDPIKIEKNTGAYQGSLYGSSSNNKMSAFFRHSNFSTKITNLYFCGGSVHPGGGIPLAISSAKIIDRYIN